MTEQSSAMNPIKTHRAYTAAPHAWEAVRDSWQQMFDVTESMRITVRMQFIRVEGSTAWICCRESISSAAGGRSSSAQAQATNIFEKRSGEWYLVHHHASMLPPSRFRDPAGI